MAASSPSGRPLRPASTGKLQDAHLCERYCSSLTCSNQSTPLPSSFSTIAIWDIEVVEVAPCQCFLPGAHHTTSPGRISSLGSPQHWVHPQPAVTIKIWPSGCVCHAVRAPGSNVTLAPSDRAGAGGSNRGSIRTSPVKYWNGPCTDGREPLRLISIVASPFTLLLEPGECYLRRRRVPFA